MNEYAFSIFFIWMAILIIFSFFVDYLLARIFSRGAHRFFVFLGVIVHEYSHALGCLITGTKIKEIKLFEESGGHVTHAKRNPFITAIIAMMPLFGCSAFLLFLAFLFEYAGVTFHSTDISLASGNFINSFGNIIVAAGLTFYENIIKLDVSTIFFIIFLYFVGSVAATIAPSGTDLKNAFIGLVIIAIMGFLTIYLHPLGYIPGISERFGTPTPILDFIVYWLTRAVGIGMIGVFLILIILIPIAIIKRR
jgi:hypothetical protein